MSISISEIPQIFVSIRKQLKAEIKGNCPNKADPLDESQMEKLWTTGAVDIKTPHTSRMLGMRGQVEYLNRCKIQDFKDFNWRPISLLNVDTKIVSIIKSVLPNIIYHNQTGYVKDRFIGETIRSIYDVMDYTVEENIPGLLIFIDFEKAFDSVEWDFLFK